MLTEVKCIIAGKVQMVGFRDFVQNSAKDYELTGWVKNLDDGKVEVLAQGILDNLKLFVEDMNGGSVLSEIESVGVEWGTSSKHFDEFLVIYN